MAKAKKSAEAIIDDILKEVALEEEVESEDEIDSEEPVKEEPSPKKKEKKTFNDSDMITCKSVRNGALYMKGRNSGSLYVWSSVDDEIGVSYRDLLSEVRARSSFVYLPMFIICDEDFVEQFPELKRFYEERYDAKALHKILALPVGSLKDAVLALPSNAQTELMQLACVQIGNGALDSLQKIKVLDEIFGTDLTLVASANG